MTEGMLYGNRWHSPWPMWRVWAGTRGYIIRGDLGGGGSSSPIQRHPAKLYFPLLSTPHLTTQSQWFTSTRISIFARPPASQRTSVPMTIRIHARCRIMELEEFNNLVSWRMIGTRPPNVVSRLSRCPTTWRQSLTVTVSTITLISSIRASTCCLQ